MLTFISFGSGSCGNCYYLGNETSAILIDCGIGIRKLKRHFTEYGVKIPHIKAVLITHDHSDHIKAAAYLSNEFNIPVYSTEAIHKGIDNNWNTTKKIVAANRRNIMPDTPFQIEEFTITPFSLPHDASENMGYSVKYQGDVFTVMTDVGKVTENVKKFVALSNHIVIESNYDLDMLRVGSYPEHLKDRITNGTGHLCNSETAEVLSKCYHPGLRNIFLCHLSEENNHPDVALHTVERSMNNAGYVNGKDYKLITLKRKLASGPFTIKQ